MRMASEMSVYFNGTECEPSGTESVQVELCDMVLKAHKEQHEEPAWNQPPTRKPRLRRGLVGRTGFEPVTSCV